MDPPIFSPPGEGVFFFRGEHDGNPAFSLAIRPILRLGSPGFDSFVGPIRSFFE